VAALSTVADYVSTARTLLQDTVNSPYRYSDADLLAALTEAFPEAKLKRPDLFITINTTLPVYTANDNTAVAFDPMYRQALVYFMVGMMQLRDDEETQDQRAAAFLQLFSQKLTGGV
jgi:hypothetical protein